jgi:multiple sugar transport system permease protein
MSASAQKIRRVGASAGAHAVLLLAVIFFAVPIYWLVTSALKSPTDVWALPPVIIFRPTLRYFLEVVQDRHIIRFLLNSVIVSGGSSMIALVLGCLAAYGLTRFEVKGSRHVAFWIISLRMMPPIATVLPLYIIFSRARLLDTYGALILAHVSFNLPFAVWMLRSFLRDIPRQLDEAAWVDGCSPIQGLIKVVLPVLRPGLAATTIFLVIWSWNEYLFAFSLTSTRAATLPVLISGFLGDYIWEWSAFYAAGTMAAVVMIVLALAVQRQLVRGLTLGAVAAE